MLQEAMVLQGRCWAKPPTVSVLEHAAWWTMEKPTSAWIIPVGITALRRLSAAQARTGCGLLLTRS